MDPNLLQISLELPEPLARSLLAYQQQRAIASTPTAILNIVEQFFTVEESNPRYATQEQLQRLEAKVESLAREIALLPQFPPQVSTVVTPNAPALPLSCTSATFTFLATDEEMEDEPDEILYDFIDE